MWWIIGLLLVLWLIFGSLTQAFEVVLWGVLIIVVIAIGAAVVRYFNRKNRV